MISLWMLYSIAVAALLAGAVAALERVLLGAGRETRWAWGAAMAATAAVAMLAPWTAGAERAESAAGAAPGAGVGELQVVAVDAVAPGVASTVEPALALLWLASSAALLLALAASALLLARRRRTWRRRVVGGTAVLVSDHTGPAVVGFLWPEAVVPRWVLELGESQQRLLVEHELEHERAGDALLLLGALLALAAMPWNLPLWWQLRRLRLAIEVDCDARVLRRRPGGHAYGLLLLEVARRRSAAPLAATAFSGRGAPALERRIRLLTRGVARPRRVPLAALAAVALLCPALVYALPAPAAPWLPQASVAGAGRLPSLPGPLVSDTPPPAPGEPRFTPYDVKPELTNRAELAEAIRRAYPAALRDAGVDGTTLLWVYIDESGTVESTRVTTSSGHEELDRAAETAIRQARFTPARNRGRAVPVWIQLPVTFRAGAPAPPTAREAPAAPRVPIWRSGTAADTLRPTFTPYDVKPELLDRAALARALEEEYPPDLREAGVRGTTVLWVYIDATGEVAQTRVVERSGHPELDRAAEAVMRRARFTPARHQGEAVPVWIQLPVTFATATGG